MTDDRTLDDGSEGDTMDDVPCDGTCDQVLRCLVASHGDDYATIVKEFKARPDVADLIGYLIVRRARDFVRRDDAAIERRSDGIARRAGLIRVGSPRQYANTTPGSTAALALVESWRLLSRRKVSVPGVGYRTWEEMTVADHLARAKWLRESVDETLRDADRHERIARALEDAGVKTLRELLAKYEAGHVAA